MTQPNQSMSLTQKSSAMENLSSLKNQLIDTHLNTLFAEDSKRFNHFSVEYDQIVLDFSKHRINQSIINGLVELADERNLGQWIQKLFSTELINYTERRAAMHWALRIPKDSSFQPEITEQVHVQLDRMYALVEKIHSGQYWCWRFRFGSTNGDSRAV